MEKAVLICGIIRSEEISAQDILASLAEIFGEVRGHTHTSAEIDFDFTDYYQKEMGKNLKRFWVGFLGGEKNFDPGQLAFYKNLARRLEEEKFSVSGHNGKKNRRVNIDPGYLTPSKVVLASTKDFSHRIYLSDGIYGEVTLIFSDGKFNPLPWTYPDYRSNMFLEFAVQVRKDLLKKY